MSEQFPLQLRYCSWMCVLQGQGKQNSISYYCTRRENWLKAKFRQKQAVPYPAITCLWNVNRHGFSCYQTMLCHEHRPDSPAVSDLVLSSYAVYRKVYVNRDEIQQIARWVWQQTSAFIFSQNGDTASYIVHAEQSLFCLRMIRNIKTYTSRCCCTFISVIGFLPLVIFPPACYVTIRRLMINLRRYEWGALWWNPWDSCCLISYSHSTPGTPYTRSVVAYY